MFNIKFAKGWPISCVKKWLIWFGIYSGDSNYLWTTIIFLNILILVISIIILLSTIKIFRNTIKPTILRKIRKIIFRT